MKAVEAEQEEQDGPDVLSVRHLSLSFGRVPVLRSVSFELKSRELLGLVGHNGSGKSTIVKVLAGYHAPSPGSELYLRGEPVPLPLSADAQLGLGLSFVHQDLALIPGATAWENIGLGRYAQTSLGAIAVGFERQSARRLLDSVDCAIAADALVREQPATEQARIAIARALRRLEESDQTGALVLDEATNFFEKREAGHFLQRVKRQAQAIGIGVMVIGHRLDEIIANCDRILVLRDGRIVAEVAGADCDEDDLVRLMIVGRPAAALRPDSGVENQPGSEPDRGRELPPAEAGGARLALAAAGLQVRADGIPLDVTIRAGEIVGVTGLKGAGWEDIVRVVGGDQPGVGGVIRVGAKEFNVRRWDAHVAVALGIGYVPAEQTRGAVFDASAAENLWLPSLARFVSRGFLRWRPAIAAAARTLSRLGVIPPSAKQRMGAFSGGNRQKMIVGKWIAAKSGVLVLDEPTQGVDVHARAELIARVRAVAGEGVGVLVASQDTRDLAALCDRVLVMRDREFCAELVGPDVSSERIASECYGQV